MYSIEVTSLRNAGAYEEAYVLFSGRGTMVRYAYCSGKSGECHVGTWRTDREYLIRRGSVRTSWPGFV